MSSSFSVSDKGTSFVSVFSFSASSIVVDIDGGGGDGTFVGVSSSVTASVVI